MSGVAKKVAGELSKICEQLGDALKKGHGAAHEVVEREAHQVATTVDATEELVASAVLTPSVRHRRRSRAGRSGLPLWSPSLHIFHGVYSSTKNRLSGYHLRPGGKDVGEAHFDPASRYALPNSCYSGFWMFKDGNGGYVQKARC